MEPEVIEISDEDDVAPRKPARNRTRKPIFIDLSELSDDEESDNPRCLIAGGEQDDDIDVDDGAPFPEISLPLPPPCTYEQVLAGVEPEMRALGAPDWAVEMAAELMFNVEYDLKYKTLLHLDKVVEKSANVTHFMSTMNRGRGDGEKTHYELCTFKSGKYPCSEPYNLRSIFTVRDLDFLTMRDLRWYITGYGHAVPETRRERVKLLKIIIVPLEVIEISDEDDVRPPKPARSQTRKPIFVDLSGLDDDEDGGKKDEKSKSSGPRRVRVSRKQKDLEIDDGAPFPGVDLQLPPPPTYEQVLTEVEPGMRAAGAPDWAVHMAARLMFSAEYKLDYETLLQLDKVVKTTTNVTHFMSTANRARGDGKKTHYELCTFKNGKYPCNKPYNLRSIFTARDLDFLTMRDLRWYIMGYGHAVPETRRERVKLLKAIIGIIV
ncbi:hypothetical protein EV715DRAFT_288211 [Schizophyllum commune]